MGNLFPHPDGEFLRDRELSESQRVAQRRRDRLHEWWDARALLPPC